MRHFALLGAAFLVWCSLDASADDVTNSPHNLTTLGPGNLRLSVIPTDGGGVQREEICVFCHTPHHANTGIEAPLWNRAITTSTFTMYSSPTIDMTIAGQPQGVSLACLSCHDGTIAFDQLLNAHGPEGYDVTAPSRGWTFNGGNNDMTASTYAYIGTDLSNDHPVSITFDPTADTMFNSQVSIEAAGIRFFGPASDQVECASCHNPHDPTNRPFMRVTNDYSNLCLTCHIK